MGGGLRGDTECGAAGVGGGGMGVPIGGIVPIGEYKMGLWCQR